MMILRTLVFVPLLCLAACPSTPPPVSPPPDAADASPVPPPPLPVDAAAPSDAATSSCQAACDVYARLGCPEMSAANAAYCVPTCARTVGTPFNASPDCVRLCADVACVRACDPNNCPGK